MHEENDGDTHSHRTPACQNIMYRRCWIGNELNIAVRRTLPADSLNTALLSTDKFLANEQKFLHRTVKSDTNTSKCSLSLFRRRRLACRKHTTNYNAGLQSISEDQRHKFLEITAIQRVSKHKCELKTTLSSNICQMRVHIFPLWEWNNERQSEPIGGFIRTNLFQTSLLLPALMLQTALSLGEIPCGSLISALTLEIQAIFQGAERTNFTRPSVRNKVFHGQSKTRNKTQTNSGQVRYWRIHREELWRDRERERRKETKKQRPQQKAFDKKLKKPAFAFPSTESLAGMSKCPFLLLNEEKQTMQTNTWAAELDFYLYRNVRDWKELRALNKFMKKDGSCRARPEAFKQ